MTKSKKNIIYEYAKSSLVDIGNFARFVSYAEDLSQVDELFESKEDQESYDQLWFELEIINALALYQWETEGRPLEWKTQWESCYKNDASHIIDDLVSLLK